jgi:CTP synthase (UTP-ammonia lyase)
MCLPPVKQTMLLGRIYLSVVKGKKESFWETVQVVPHITKIKDRMQLLGKSGDDVVITEIGGTVGDIESLPYIDQFVNWYGIWVKRTPL